MFIPNLKIILIPESASSFYVPLAEISIYFSNTDLLELGIGIDSNVADIAFLLWTYILYIHTQWNGELKSPSTACVTKREIHKRTQAVCAKPLNVERWHIKYL